MLEIYERVIVANDQSCTSGNAKTAVVHACKSPCHQGEIGYRGNLPNTHPNYLVLEKENDLFLNIIDPPVPLFKPALFITFLDFAKNHWEQGQTILIHCNQGESRAPSLAMLFLAKSIGSIPDTSYEAARAAFEKLYPRYNPGQGIQTYFSKHWLLLGTDF
ncbi:hypothetical protein [Idiomarina sp.]|uniref:hypothetical protein n=1 Tax=Idiomarina sp. TaxID=1874361 RepID=UPI0025C14C1F|nr:hypothetical protein [Idiomarina sp.]